MAGAEVRRAAARRAVCACEHGGGGFSRDGACACVLWHVRVCERACVRITHVRVHVLGAVCAYVNACVHACARERAWVVHVCV